MPKRYLIICLFVFQFTSFIYPQENKTNPVMLVFGTRPEAIKMIPLYKALQKEQIPVFLCTTGQHTQLVDDVMTLFDIQPDFDFHIMKPGQDLFYITDEVLNKTKELFSEIKPSLVVVQGDTTSGLAAAISAFYSGIPVAHIEAGLRSGNIFAPFPEEFNRKAISLISSYHFAPTELTKNNLLKEGINEESVFCTGNTVVDSLFQIKDKLDLSEIVPSSLIQKTIHEQKLKNSQIIMLTLHRRESFDGGVENVLRAIKDLLNEKKDLFIIYPSHPNPTVQSIIKKVDFSSMDNIMILPPLNYVDMVYVLSEVDIIATDSGGVQEEAISFNKPVLVLRNETDRPEGLENGRAILVGTDRDHVKKEIKNLLNTNYQREPRLSTYGDGHAAEKIAKIIKNQIITRGAS